MTEAVLHLVAAHGALLVLVMAFLSSMGVPVPGSLTLLGAGAFAASGEASLQGIAAAGLAGALTGDQVGYWLGAKGGPRAIAWAGRHGMESTIIRARAFTARWGDAGNFVCRWLISPLAPAINLVNGAIGVRWARFTFFCVLGEMVWVTLYVGLGYAFSRSIVAIARVGSDLGIFLAAGLVAVAIGTRLLTQRRAAS